MHVVKKLLDNLDSHKATGLDNIPTYLHKQLDAELAPALGYKASLKQCYVPIDGKYCPWSLKWV